MQRLLEKVPGKQVAGGSLPCRLDTPAAPPRDAALRVRVETAFLSKESNAFGSLGVGLVRREVG